jgi:hypothetical protein
MSQENVERYRANLEEFRAASSGSNWEPWLTSLSEVLDPEIEWDASDSPVPQHRRGVPGPGGGGPVVARVARRLADRRVRVRAGGRGRSRRPATRSADAGALHGHRGKSREVRARRHVQGWAVGPLESVREPVRSPRSRRAVGVGEFVPWKPHPQNGGEAISRLAL